MVDLLGVDPPGVVSNCCGGLEFLADLPGVELDQPLTTEIFYPAAAATDRNDQHQDEGETSATADRDTAPTHAGSPTTVLDPRRLLGWLAVPDHRGPFSVSRRTRFELSLIHTGRYGDSHAT